MVNRVGAALIEGLLPNRCALCGLRSHRALPLCLDCEAEMPRNDRCCARCAIPLPAAQDGEHERLCGQCLRAPPPFARVIAPWVYGEYLAYLIHRWKYHREQYLTRLLAALWLQQAAPFSAPDLLVPVPLHWARRWRRGFNQAEALARQLLATCPALETSSLATRLVTRRRATAAQPGMGARERRANLRNAFTAREPCDNLRVAIVDDVLTTGATAAALAATLITAGASHVEVWCLARTPPPAH